jgi:hypothetical protein
MYIIAPNKKQKLSLAQKYRQYLGEQPEPSDRSHNKSNIFDDLNTADKAMMKKAKLYLRRSKGAGKSPNGSEETLRDGKERIMPKDRGRKAVKKPRQIKAKLEAGHG